jgi:c-di-GMP phosphodiesterase
MKSLYKTILSRFISASLIPVFFIEVSLVVALFWMNSSQSSQTKESLRQISAETFSQIAQGTGQEIQQHFLQLKHEISQLSFLASSMFSNPSFYHPPKTELRLEEGFFMDAKKGERSSVYTTNLKQLDANDRKNIDLLSMLDAYVQKLVTSDKDLLQGAWINIGKYYNLFYPKIDVINELSSDLDVTQQLFYYEADEKHNPDKQIKFISLYNESWATQFGQMGAYLSPIYANEKFVGVIGFNVTVNKTVKTLTDLKLPFNAFAILVDKDKQLLASSDENKSFSQMGVHSFYSQYLLAKEGKMFSKLESMDAANLLNDDKMIFPYKITGTEYTIMFCANNSDIYASVDARYNYLQEISFYILAAIAFFYSIYFLYVFRHVKNLALKITHPITDMVRLSSKLGKDETMKLPDTNISELHVLNHNFMYTHETLIELVNYDATTGLYNHRKLRGDINECLEKKNLIFFKLENFSEYNNLFGPEVGSKALVELVRHIQGCASGGTLYRENTDTIALLTNAYEKETAIQNLKEMLRRIGSEKVLFEGIEISFSVKVGMTLGNIDDGINLIAQAHIAVSQSVLRSVDRYAVYEDIFEVTKVYQENLLWSKHVKDAFSENRFVPFYQPIFCYESGKIEKFESLVRMELDGEIISPFKFLNAASSMGRLHDITLVMVDNVFSMASRYPELEFSVNTSFDDFEEGKLLEYVKIKLHEYAIDSSKIIFELLETQTFSNENNIVAMIDELKVLGFKIAIDDFGTGHSNFSHVAKLNVDFIKIDGMFIKDLESNDMSKKMVNSMVGFSREIGAKVIGEFVHNKAVFEIVESLGVDYAQGYYKSPPLSAKEVDELLKDRG